MLRRIAQHYVGIKIQSEHKYRLLAAAQRRGFTITFDVLFYAARQKRADILEEISNAEGVFIRKYRPLLNAQIPEKDNWRKYSYNEYAAKMTTDEFIAAIS